MTPDERRTLREFCAEAIEYGECDIHEYMRIAGPLEMLSLLAALDAKEQEIERQHDIATRQTKDAIVAIEFAGRMRQRAEQAEAEVARLRAALIEIDAELGPGAGQPEIEAMREIVAALTPPAAEEPTP